MRHAAVLAALGCLALGRPAAACPDGAIFEPLALPLGIGLVGGYAIGTGTFVYRDLTGGRPTLDYATTELALSGVLATAFGMGAVDAFGKHAPGSGLVLTGLAGLHGALAIHGARRIGTAWHVKPGVVPWVEGFAYVTETLAFTGGLGHEHSRAYGAVEAGIQTPLAAGLGYLAYDRLRDGNRGPAMLYGGMAVISGAFAVHGVRTAVARRAVPRLDLLGTDVVPTLVDDGHELGAGLGTSGTW